MNQTFDSDQDDQTYPDDNFIRLAAKQMWHDTVLLNHQSSDVTTQLSAINSAHLIAFPIEDTWYTTMSGQEKQCAFLAISLSHPNAANETLRAISELLQLPVGYLYICAAMTGRIELIEPALSDELHDILTQLHPSESTLSGLQQLTTLAVAHGHINLVEHIAKIAPGSIEPIIRMNHYEVFKASAYSNQFPVMQRLMTLACPNINHLIRQGEYTLAFRETLLTALNFVLNTIIIKALNWIYPNWFNPVLHDNVNTMLHDDNDRALTRVAQSGNLATFQALFECYTPSYEGIAYSFIQAAEKNHEDIAYWLLSDRRGFNFAECQDSLYGSQYVHPFVDEQLADLKQRQQHALDSNQTFDVHNAQEKLLCISMARNLIRRNNPALLDDIRFLLNIPSVQAIADTHSTYEPNSLLRLALTIQNQEAIDFLLTIPAIAQLAEQQDYYRAERRNGLDANIMSHDRESSLRALSAGERQRLERATAHYAPKIRELGTATIINQLRQLLISRYQSNPATLLRDDQTTIPLPTDWRRFQALALTPAERQRALLAYYQDKNHTALRLLLKPNPWIHPQAPFVMTSEQGQWAGFETHQPLIALFFLAAGDEDYGQGELAIDQFIDELAHINRAHNWDNTRTNGQGVEKEYDDLTADKPSCTSGMKRRLFQSVLNHPLLSVLSKERIDEELRSFIRNHYRLVITQGDYTRLKQAWDNYITEPNKQDLALLREFNISSIQQQTFRMQLQQRYGSQFTDDPLLVRQVNQAFNLQTNTEAHAVNCAGLANLDQLFQVQPPQVQNESPLWGGFFNHDAQDTNDLSPEEFKEGVEDPSKIYINTYR